MISCSSVAVTLAVLGTVRHVVQLQHKGCRFGVALEGELGDTGQNSLAHADFARPPSGAELDFTIEYLAEQCRSVFFALRATFRIPGMTRLEPMFPRGLPITDRIGSRVGPRLANTTNTRNLTHGAPRVLGAHRANLVEGFAAVLENGVAPGIGLPTTNGGVDITRIELETVAAPADPLGGENRRPGSHEGIEHDVAPARAVTNRVGNQRDGLRRWVNGQVVQASRP